MKTNLLFCAAVTWCGLVNSKARTREAEETGTPIAEATFFSRPHAETQPVIEQLAKLEEDFNAAFERWEYLENLKNGE